MAGGVMEVWAVKQLGALDTDMGRIIKITLYFIETVDSGHSLATKVAQATSTWDWRLEWGHLGTGQGGALEWRTGGEAQCPG